MIKNSDNLLDPISLFFCLRTNLAKIVIDVPSLSPIMNQIFRHNGVFQESLHAVALFVPMSYLISVAFCHSMSDKTEDFYQKILSIFITKANVNRPWSLHVRKTFLLYSVFLQSNQELRFLALSFR